MESTKVSVIHAPLRPDPWVAEVDFLGVRGEEDLEGNLLMKNNFQYTMYNAQFSSKKNKKVEDLILHSLKIEHDSPSDC